MSTSISTNLVVNECSHGKMIYDPENSEDICINCGIVVLPSYDRQQQQQQQQEQEPDNDGKPDTKGYIVPKPTKVDFSCGGFASSKIDTRNVDCVGKRVNPAQYNRLRFINSYIASSAGMSTFRNGVWHISSYADKLGPLPNHVKERAAELFEKIYYFRTNIHNSKNIVCACIYYACKEASVDRTMQDIANIAQERDKYASKIFKTYQELIEDLKLDSPKNLMISDHIEHYGSRMKLKQRIIRFAIEIYRNIKYSDPQGKMYFSGKAPRITAVVLLYISATILSKDHYEPVLHYMRAAELNEYIFRKRVKEHLENDRFKIYRQYVLIV